MKPTHLTPQPLQLMELVMKNMECKCNKEHKAWDLNGFVASDQRHPCK